MKKTLIFLAVALLGGTAMAQRQYDTLCGPDGRIPHWHYTRWYDTVDTYYHDTAVAASMPDSVPLRLYEHGSDGMRVHVKDEYVEHESLLKGVAVWQGDPKDYHFGYPHGTTRVPEYVYLFKWNRTRDSLLVIDSLRWDTAEVKVLKLPRHSDTARFGFMYCYVSEAYFDKPVYVDSTFLLGGTANNNIVESNWLPNLPTIYVSASPMWQTRVDMSIRWDHWIYNPADSSTRSCIPKVEYGYYMPIIEYAELDVRPADSTQGTAGPTGLRSKGTDQEIWARGRLGYRFSHWQDSVTDNPRTIHLMSDTAFTAYFEALPVHTVEGLCGDGHGYVEGEGEYCEGETATLVARPHTPEYRFSHWQDSVTDNPRSFVVTQDTVFTAYFEEGSEGITAPEVTTTFTLSPNPTNGEVTVVLPPLSEGAMLTVADATGREVRRQTLPPATEGIRLRLDLKGLPAGAYFVTVATPQGSHTEKLVVE